jgi:3-hydroxyisobutyrate dehydrogenase-like beta-hydroxyacid dehydrogenase
MKVGFIGLGQMGFGMAASLLKAGHEVTVYNRTPSKADGLVKKGAVAAKRISDACAGDAVITMLANDAAVESLVYGDQGVRASLRKGAVHISSSTISVALCERLFVDHAAAGQRFVAAPVFGRPDVAAVGELTVVAAGSQEAIADVTPLLDAIGRRTFVMSDQPRPRVSSSSAETFSLLLSSSPSGKPSRLSGKKASTGNGISKC